ncbi:hypothetical protein BMR85_018600 [Achromobacter sp. KAs 3-5]|nr:hypothetical protein BMR85_018600 [Achromobacter sp. KAs 3-5]
MKHPILYLCATAMSGLLATGASAQRVEKTLVAQAQMTTPGMGAAGQSKRDQPSGAQQPPAQTQGAQVKGANDKGAKEKQRDPGRGEPRGGGSVRGKTTPARTREAPRARRAATPARQGTAACRVPAPRRALAEPLTCAVNEGSSGPKSRNAPFQVRFRIL